MTEGLELAQAGVDHLSAQAFGIGTNGFAVWKSILESKKNLEHHQNTQDKPQLRVIRACLACI